MQRPRCAGIPLENYRVEINGNVIDSDVPKQTRELSGKLDAPIPQNV